MKLTEAKLKQLILEQFDSFKLVNLIAYLEELQTALSSAIGTIGYLGVGDHTENGKRLPNGTKLPKTESYNFQSLNDWFQLAIDSVAKEIEEGRHSGTWDYISLTRIYPLKLAGYYGNVKLTMILDKYKYVFFKLDQLDKSGNVEFSYFKGNSISTKALAGLLSASDMDILESVKEQSRLYGKETRDSSTL